MLTKARDNTLSSAVVVAGWEGAGLVLFFFFGCIYIHSPCFCKIVNCQILVFIHVAIPLSLFRGFWLVSSFGVLDPLLSVIQESGRPPKGQYLLQISVPVDLF